MKSSSRAKVGGRKGNPGYRTSSVFKYKKAVDTKTLQKPKNYKQ